MSCLGRVHFMKILTVYIMNSHLLTLKAHSHQLMFLSFIKIFEASKTNSVDPDQTAPETFSDAVILLAF